MALRHGVETDWRRKYFSSSASSVRASGSRFRSAQARRCGDRLVSLSDSGGTRISLLIAAASPAGGRSTTRSSRMCKSFAPSAVATISVAMPAAAAVAPRLVHVDDGDRGKLGRRTVEEDHRRHRGERVHEHVDRDVEDRRQADRHRDAAKVRQNGTLSEAETDSNSGSICLSAVSAVMWATV